jgi:hypothetical protein
MPSLTLTLSPRWRGGDKREELLANAIKPSAAAPEAFFGGLEWD